MVLLSTLTHSNFECLMSFGANATLLLISLPGYPSLELSKRDQGAPSCHDGYESKEQFKLSGLLDFSAPRH
jgi:hypothetical protein